MKCVRTTLHWVNDGYLRLFLDENNLQSVDISYYNKYEGAATNKYLAYSYDELSVAASELSYIVLKYGNIELVFKAFIKPISSFFYKA